MPKNNKKPKFRLISAVFATVCIILVGDAVAPTASIGNSQYVWWIVMLLGFFVPYGLISAELGTQYPSEGGMYTWVEKGFWLKMGKSRCVVLLGELPTLGCVTS